MSTRDDKIVRISDRRRQQYAPEGDARDKELVEAFNELTRQWAAARQLGAQPYPTAGGSILSFPIRQDGACASLGNDPEPPRPAA